MRAMVYHGNRDLRLEVVPDPTPTPGDALLKVDYCGICATDIEEYVYGPQFLDSSKMPIITGHEVTGTVVELPGGVTHVKVGDRVALNTVLNCGTCFWCKTGETQQCEEFAVIGFDRDGGLAEYTTWPADQLILLPESVSSEAAALVEPSSVAHHCIRRGNIQPGETVAVVGAGTVGTLAMQIAKAQGARVFAVDVKQLSLDLAKELGAEVAINAAEEDADAILKDLTEGRGPDVVIDAAGTPQTPANALRYVRRGGRVVLVAIYTSTPEFDFNSIVAQEKTVIGTIAYTRADVQASVDLIASGKLQTTPLITDTITLDQVIDVGFKRMMAPTKDVFRILVKP
jgi:(R,R)-butanediol dehydrogenase/meso-butanediol dehydrogenase/diacetyl reductase